jgi:undecaprenyl-diphosphatase
MIVDLLKAAILGILQGVTEFLPVSSTGHLILAQDLLGVDEDRYGLPFDAALHLGTLIALLVFFRSEWVRLAEGAVRTVVRRSLADEQGRLAWLIVLGTLPAAVAGVVFEPQIEKYLREPWLVATMLIAFSGVFLVAERVGGRHRDKWDMHWVDAVVVGIAQAVALVPGVSRSGATISAGLLRDVDRREAAHFAFLLSAPIIAGAAIRQLAGVAGDFADGTLGGQEAAFFATGFVTATLVGYAAIAFLLRFLAVRSMLVFAAYRVALGAIVLIVLGAQSLA